MKRLTKSDIKTVEKSLRRILTSELILMIICRGQTLDIIMNDITSVESDENDVYADKCLEVVKLAKNELDARIPSRGEK